MYRPQKPDQKSDGLEVGTLKVPALYHVIGNSRGTPYHIKEYALAHSSRASGAVRLNSFPRATAPASIP